MSKIVKFQLLRCYLNDKKGKFPEMIYVYTFYLSVAAKLKMKSKCLLLPWDSKVFLLAFKLLFRCGWVCYYSQKSGRTSYVLEGIMFLNQMEKKDFCVKATTKEIKDQFEG